MKTFAALLCLFPLVCGAATPTQLQTCTTTANATGANQLVGCPTKNVVWGPSSATDLVRVIKPSGAQGWVPFNTLTATTQVYNGNWVAFGTLTVILPPVIPPVVIPPIQTLHTYVLTWGAVKTRVDGSALTDLTGYMAQSGPALTGPWSAAVTTTATTASFTLPWNTQQCFQVVAVSASAGSSAPAQVCALKPASPTNAKAS